MADRKLPKIQNKDNISEIKPKQQNKTVNQIQNCKDLQKLCGKNYKNNSEKKIKIPKKN